MINKRKFELKNTQCIQYKNYKLLEKIYYNELTCDKIIINDNHIYFNSLINYQTIEILINYIQIIKNEYNNLLKNYEKNIYIHITSKGGILYSLSQFITFKNNNDFDLISIIENECNDVAILLASLCNYRIITKKSLCKLSQYNLYSNNLYYWGYFKQCENSIENIQTFYNDLINTFCNLIDSKINDEKIKKYLNNNCIWDSKKCKKLGFIDEII